VPTGAVLAIFIPSDLSYFSGAVSVPKGKQNFHRRLGGFTLDCFDPFSLMRKSCGNSSQVRKGGKFAGDNPVANRLRCRFDCSKTKYIVIFEYAGN
jgi:hypothetical protein